MKHIKHKSLACTIGLYDDQSKFEGNLRVATLKYTPTISNWKGRFYKKKGTNTRYH